MTQLETPFEGLYIIQHKVFSDPRGTFIKTYNQTLFDELGLPVDIKERYVSISHKNVIRGMHFQTPPHAHIKLVTVLQGSILDVVLDIRTQSKTVGTYYSLKLMANQGKTLYIPKGFAHGFLALEDDTLVEYNQTTEYVPNHDAGIKFDSFGFNWGIANPIVSERDQSLPTFANHIKLF